MTHPNFKERPILAFVSHDHQKCTHEIMTYAETSVRKAGVRLTPVRRRVLEILLESHKIMGAYEILRRLSAERLGHQPPVVYRALEFLVQNGLVHRIDDLNAFTVCMAPADSHHPAFLICTACHAIAEISGTVIHDNLTEMGHQHGFQVTRTNVKVLGLCPSCQSDGM